MIAGIFAAHGVWVGRYRTDQYNPKGYFENLDVKRQIIETSGVLNPPPRMTFDLPSHWMIKLNAVYHTAFLDYHPIYVKVWRPAEDIIKSYKRYGFMPDIDRDHDIMRSLPGVDVHSNKIVEGDYSEIQAAFDSIGLAFNPSHADDFIEKDLWTSSSN